MASLLTIKGPNPGQRSRWTATVCSSAGSRTRPSTSNRWPSAAITPASSARTASSSSRISAAATAPSSMARRISRHDAAHRARHLANRAVRLPSAADPPPMPSSPPLPDQIIRAQVDAAAVQPHAIQPEPRLQAASGPGDRPAPGPNPGDGAAAGPAARPPAAPVPPGRPRHGPAVRGRAPGRPGPALPQQERAADTITPTAGPSSAALWRRASACSARTWAAIRTWCCRRR